MRLSERSKWGICYATLGTLVLVGAIAATTTRADAAPDRARDDAQRAAQAADGQATFDRVCGRCHPHGNEDVGPRILNKNFDQAKMTKQIRSGVGRMRPISATKLPEAQMPALLTYLRSIHAVR